MDTELVKTGDLQSYLSSMLSKQKEVVEDCEKILPHVRDTKIRTSISKRIEEAKTLIEGLEKGYVPVPSSWGFHRIETKSRWSQKAVKETLSTMPEEIRIVWDKIKEEGFFDSFSITVRGGGDPLLVGNKGKKRFLIGAWLHIAPGLSLGFVQRKD